jgi:hypothetical protein
MARNYRLWENANVVSLLTPAADAAGRTSAYVSLANGHKAFIMAYINQGNAATVTLTPLQATAVGGVGSKALTSAAPIAYNLDTDTVPSDLLTIAAAATSYTTDAGVKSKLVLFEIDPIESLDINNKYNHIAVQTSASNAANITSAVLIITPIRFAQTNPPVAAGV